MGILFHRHMRRHLTTTLQRMAAEAPDDLTRQQINAVLANQDAMANLDSRVESMAEERRSGMLLEALSSSSPRQRGAILQWLWTHRQEIMQFVLQIIALFGIKVPISLPPAPAPTPTTAPAPAPTNDGGIPIGAPPAN